MTDTDDVALACEEAQRLRAHMDRTGRHTAMALAQLQLSIDQRRLLLEFRRQTGDSMLRIARKTLQASRQHVPGGPIRFS